MKNTTKSKQLVELRTIPSGTVFKMENWSGPSFLKLRATPNADGAIPVVDLSEGDIWHVAPVSLVIPLYNGTFDTGE